MDSLTQITLGAAVGEVVLGKKAGNRAMVWGAIAGTIPDLDVFANFVTDPVSALAYHRAFTHSLTFSFVTPIVLGFIIHRLYGGKDGPLPTSFWSSLGISWLALLIMIFGGSVLMPIPVYGIPKIALLISSVIIIFPLVFYAREKWRKTPSVNENPSWKAWSWLFFFSIITHPLLDCCTTYGTQLFEPFSSMRVAWNVISVADPLYTIPFLVFLIMASRQKRASIKRKYYNWAGIIISSAYMLFSSFLMFKAQKILDDTIKKDNIQAINTIVGPTILNNILWNGTVETDSFYYAGFYSFFDKEPFYKLAPIPKNHHLIKDHWNDEHVKILRWFSNDFFSVHQLDNNTFRIGDLRFGAVSAQNNEPPNYIFYFDVQEKDGELRAIHVQQGPKDRKAGMSALFERIGGG